MGPQGHGRPWSPPAIMAAGVLIILTGLLMSGLAGQNPSASASNVQGIMIFILIGFLFLLVGVVRLSRARRTQTQFQQL
jgi:hypothetical protein